MKNQKVGAIIQARIGSERLPGKVLFELGKETVLSSVIKRLKKVEGLDIIVVATTTLEQDDSIVKEVQKYKDVKLYRGSSDDVLNRYAEAATSFGIDIIIRITADCPFLDPVLISQGLKSFFSERLDLVTNAGPDLSKRSFPRGLDFEIFRADELIRISNKNVSKHDREHVTAYFYKNQYDIKYEVFEVDLSYIRITLDTEEDYLLLKEVHKNLHSLDREFGLNDIQTLFSNKPELLEINQHVKQKV